MTRRRAGRKAELSMRYSRRYEDRVSDKAQLLWTFFVAIVMAAAALMRIGIPGTELLEASAKSSFNPSYSDISIKQDAARIPASHSVP